MTPSRQVPGAADQDHQGFTEIEVGLIKKKNAGYLKTIKDSGTEVIELTPEEFKEFKDAVSPVYDWFVKNVPDGQNYLDLAKTNISRGAAFAAPRFPGLPCNC